MRQKPLCGLAGAGDVDNRTRRSHFQITERGKQSLEQHPTRIDNTVLRQFPEFLAFQRPRGAEPAEREEVAATADDVIDARTTPEELIQEAEAEISEDLQAQILDRIAQQSPAFFERLVVDLLGAMGYGGSRGRVVQRLGRPGDEGIDGVINEDALGLGVVYVQAKRYAAGNTIGREQIQQFAGALVGKGATKGVFVTTSAFSRGAIDYPRTIPHLRIVLIDGKELAKLMVQYNVGVLQRRLDEILLLNIGQHVGDHERQAGLVGPFEAGNAGEMSAKGRLSGWKSRLDAGPGPKADRIELSAADCVILVRPSGAVILGLKPPPKELWPRQERCRGREETLRT